MQLSGVKLSTHEKETHIGFHAFTRLATSLFPNLKSPRQTHSTARNLSADPSKKRWGNRLVGFALS